MCQKIDGIGVWAMPTLLYTAQKSLITMHTTVFLTTHLSKEFVTDTHVLGTKHPINLQHVKYFTTHIFPSTSKSISMYLAILNC